MTASATVAATQRKHFTVAPLVGEVLLEPVVHLARLAASQVLELLAEHFEGEFLRHTVGALLLLGAEAFVPAQPADPERGQQAAADLEPGNHDRLRRVREVVSG